MFLPFGIGTCWKCGDTQGPWSLCELNEKGHKCKIWLCPNCEKEFDLYHEKNKNPFEEVEK